MLSVLAIALDWNCPHHPCRSSYRHFDVEEFFGSNRFEYGIPFRSRSKGQTPAFQDAIKRVFDSNIYTLLLAFWLFNDFYSNDNTIMNISFSTGSNAQSCFWIRVNSNWRKRKQSLIEKRKNFLDKIKIAHLDYSDKDRWWWWWWTHQWITNPNRKWIREWMD